MGRFDFKTRIGQISAIIQSGGFDTDAIAFFNRVTVAGGTLTTTEQNAINMLVIEMKSNNIWNSMKAIYPMVGASAAACSQNLKSSSFTGAFSSGWTFASMGVTGNGTSSFMNTTFNPNTNGNLNDGHLSLYSRTQNTTGIDMGALDGATNFTNLYLSYTGISVFRWAFVPPPDFTVSNTNTVGFFVGSRTTSSNLFLKQNATLLGTSTIASNAKTNAAIYIGAVNNAGSAIIPTSKQYAFASIGDGLTDTQASDFYTVVQAFQTTLSRQV